MSERNANMHLSDVPAYTLREAARLTSVGFGTLHGWTHGPRPIIRLDSEFWTFTNLVEAHTLRALRKTHSLRLSAVRAAVAYVEGRLKVSHPLAAKVFRTDGVDLFIDKFGKLTNASNDGQVAMREMFAERLRHVEYDRTGRAARLFVDAERRLIVIDPKLGFGRPVLAGTRVPVETVVARFESGETPQALARDYVVKEEQIHQAIRTVIKTNAA